MKTITGFLAGAVAVFAGLSAVTAAQPGQQQQQVPQQSPGGQVVAMVNGDPITQMELQTSLQSRLRGQQPDPEQVQKIQKQVLESLVESRLVEQYVLDEGPGAEKQEVDQLMQRFQQQLESQEMTLKEFLQSRGQTEEQFRKRIAGSIAWQKFQQKQLTPEKLQEFFQNNSEQFQAESFQQAQQEVRRAYTEKLWNDIVQQMKPEAEIKMVKPNSQPRPNRGLPPQPQQR